MKNTLLILTLIVVCGLSAANASVKVVPAKKNAITIVTEYNSNFAFPEEEKDKKKTTSCTEAQKKSCTASGKTCGSVKAEPAAKKGCCGEKK